MIRHLDIEHFSEFDQQPPPRVVARKVLYLPMERLRPQVRFMHESTGAVVAPRLVHDHCLAMFRSATGTLTCDGEKHAITPGRLLVMPPFLPHQIHLDAAADPTHIAIHCDLAPDFPDNGELSKRLPYEIRFTEALELGVSCALPQKVSWYGELVETMRLFWLSTPQAMLQADADIFRLIAAALTPRTGRPSEKAGGDRGDAAVARVLAYLDDHLGADITLEKLAEIGAVSVPHLNRLFRTRLGYPPRLYVTRLRMTKAREMLRDDRLGIKEIAFKVGYTDPHSFGRIFHRLDGRTPSKYRAMPRTKYPN